MGITSHPRKLLLTVCTLIAIEWSSVVSLALPVIAESFSPFWALAGGVAMGVAAALLLWVNGRIAGISNVLRHVFPLRRNHAWRLYFLSGLVLAGFAASLIPGFHFPPGDGELPTLKGAFVLLLAGFLVGAGAQLANGCTSGHGICGLARGGQRSLAAVGVFMATGFVFATLLGVFL